MKKPQIISHKSKKYVSNFFCFLSLFAIFNLLFVTPVLSENLSSDSYRIQMGNLNMGSGLPASSNYKLGITGGQTAPGPYSSTGYLVRASFWYLKTIVPFSFTISNLSIDFGTLIAGVPSVRTNMLSVSTGGAGGYQVTAQENDAMRTIAGTATIPDTTCNGGADTCDEINAKPWTDNGKYGFGYNMSGDDVPSTFVNSTYFRPFPSKNDNEEPAVVMSSSQARKNRVATVTYKVNISGSQAAGNYENYIVFIATPTY